MNAEFNGSNQNINELYQQVILDHNKNPKNYKVLEPCTAHKEGHNPLCGDHLHLYLRMDQSGENIEAVTFQGEGCAISKASTSMMTQFLQGVSLEKALTLFDEFHRLLTRKLDPDKDLNALGKLKLFSGIWKYPSRVKCAGLAWHTLKAMVDELQERGEVTPTAVKTE